MAQPNAIFVTARKPYINAVFTMLTWKALPVEGGGLGGGESVARFPEIFRAMKFTRSALRLHPTPYLVPSRGEGDCASRFVQHATRVL